MAAPSYAPNAQSTRGASAHKPRLAQGDHQCQRMPQANPDNAQAPQPGTPPTDHPKTRPIDGDTGPITLPGNEIEHHGNIARSGGGQRKDKDAGRTEHGDPPIRSGASKNAAERRSGPTPKQNSSSTPRPGQPS